MGQLKLKHPPVPSNAARFAEDMVAAAAEINGVALDYSVASLQAVDDIIGRWHDDGTPTANLGETLFGFGCYVGEVFVRAAGGRWVESTSTAAPAQGLSGFPLVVELENGTVVNPIGKAFKRLQNGSEDNLPHFYAVFTKAQPRSRPWWMFWKT